MSTTLVKKGAKPTPEQAAQLADGWRYVKIPALDIYDQPFEGIWLNKDHYLPGTHLVAPIIADELERVLEVWQDSMIRLMRPGQHKKSVQQALRRGAGVEQLSDAEVENIQ